MAFAKQKEKEGVVSVCLTAYVSCFCTYRTNMNRVCTKIPKVLAAKFLGFFPGLQNNQKLNCSRAVFMGYIRLNPVHFWKGLQSLYKYSHNSDQPCSYFRHLPSTFIGLVLNDLWPKAEQSFGLVGAPNLQDLENALQMKQSRCNTLSSCSHGLQVLLRSTKYGFVMTPETSLTRIISKGHLSKRKDDMCLLKGFMQ